MRIGLLVIGDEILRGKRQDKHLPWVINLLAGRGLELAYARFLGDDDVIIASAMRDARAAGDLLLSCGGIGATPDDRTRQAAALAYDVPLARHPEGEALILAEYAERARPNRVLMADFPAGARLIPNPVNRVPGFSIGQLHAVPGFPEMAWPMLEWVLQVEYPQLCNATPPVEYRLRVMGTAGEGDLLEIMEDTLARFPGLQLSSLPCRGDAERPRHIEFGLRGAKDFAAAAYHHFDARLAADFPELIREALTPPR